MSDERLMGELQMCCDIVAPLFSEDPAQPVLWPLLESLAGGNPAQLAAEWSLQREDADSAVEAAWKQLCAGASCALEAPRDASRAFHHLFVGPGHLEAPPWGSVYTDHEKVCFGESCLELGLWMRKHGIERLAARTEPADHIGRMLSLLSWLAQHRPELVGEYLSQHLLTWGRHYFERFMPVAQREGHPLYCAAAVLADELLAASQERMGLEVSYPRYFM